MIFRYQTSKNKETSFRQKEHHITDSHSRKYITITYINQMYEYISSQRNEAKSYMPSFAQ